MTIHQKEVFICDGCGGDAHDKSYLVLRLSIQKDRFDGKPIEKPIIQDYCAPCRDQVIAAIKEGAFREKRK